MLRRPNSNTMRIANEDDPWISPDLRSIIAILKEGQHLMIAAPREMVRGVGASDVLEGALCIGFSAALLA